MAGALPPLPKIEGDVDLFLDVFTHNSLRMESAPMNEEYGNTDRLAELGASTLRLVVATHFFRQKPLLSADEIAGQIKEHLSDEIVDQWMAKYNLKTKLRIAPAEMKRIHDVKASSVSIHRHKPSYPMSLFVFQEMRKVFETYIGALYIRNGLGSIQPWISRLIDPTCSDPILLDGTSSGTATATASQASTPMMSMSPPPPPPPKTLPPPMPPMYSKGPPHFQGVAPQSSQAVYNMVTVALMNQKASQMGYQVTYPAEHSGPPHNPLWTVRCCLNNKEYGRGSGKSQKIAKDEAARKAWAAMGW